MLKQDPNTTQNMHVLKSAYFQTFVTRENFEVITVTKKKVTNNFKLFFVYLQQYSHHFVVANDFDGNVLVPTSSIPGPYNVTEHPLAGVAIHSVTFFQQLSNSHTCQQKSYCPWTLPIQCRHTQWSFFPAAFTPVNRNHTVTEHSLAGGAIHHVVFF